MSPSSSRTVFDHGMFCALGTCPGTIADSCGEVRRSQQLAGELLRRADVHEVLLADRGEHVVAERADGPVRAPWPCTSSRYGSGTSSRQLAALELPLLASAVHELDVVVAVVPQVPVRVRGEPVVVAAVQHDLRVVGDRKHHRYCRPGDICLDVALTRTAGVPDDR